MSDNDSHPVPPEATPAQTAAQPSAASTPEPSPAHDTPADDAGDNTMAGGLDDLMSSFQLAPSWARDGGDATDKWQKYEGRDYRDDRRSRGGGDRGGGAPRRDGGRGPGGGGGPRRDGPPRREGSANGPRRDGPSGRQGPSGAPRFSAPAGGAPHGAGGPPREERGPPREFRGGRGEFRGGFRPPPRLPVRIDFLPERTTLNKIVNIIRKSCQAVTLDEIAQRFLAHPDALQVKIHPRDGTPAEHTVAFYQIKGSGAFFLDRAEAEATATRTGLSDFFETAEVEVPAPTGKFTCVAKCGITGELLGPPNHHSYAEAVDRIRGERCAEVPLEDYKRRVIMMHEPEAVEAWKQSQTKITKYGEKGAEEKTLTRREAEHAFRTRHLPGLISETRRIIAPMRAAMAVTDPVLSRQIRECQEREQARPFSILLALRPALKHMGLHFFKARGGQQHVAAAAPAPLDPAQVAGPIKPVLEYLAANPASKRDAILEGLHPGATKESPESSQLATHLRWLLEKGHVIEFSDGTYEVPRPRPPQGPGKAAASADDDDAGESAGAEPAAEAATSEALSSNDEPVAESAPSVGDTLPDAPPTEESAPTT